MKTFISPCLLLLLSLAFFSGCMGGNVIPQKDLVRLSADKTYNSQKLFELGAERYMNYDYENAIYYYSNIITIFSNDNEAVAWANYEIGFCRYEEGRFTEALQYFKNVLAINSFAQGPKLLAGQMKVKVENKINPIH